MSGGTGKSWGGKEVNGYTDPTLLPTYEKGMETQSGEANAPK